jgi:acetamidase/formamidase
MHSIRIDRGRRLAQEPHLGHNRFHPDLVPIAEIGEGEEAALETETHSTASSGRERRSPILRLSMRVRCIR